MTVPAGRPPAERWFDPTKLLEDLAILQPEEIDVAMIAEYVGATVVYEELRGCGGGLVARGDRAIITADSRSSRAEQRLAVAHELAHWILDRGESGLVPSDPMGVYVNWFDEEGHEEDVTPEERADGWAIELLVPETMLFDEFTWDEPVTFAKVRDLCRRFDTPFLPTARHVVWLSPEKTALVRSRPGGGTELLRRKDHALRSCLRREPGPGTAAHDLLHGLREEAPGATWVGSDGWLELEGVWWCPVSEDSMVMEDGEVLSLLWWPGDAMHVILREWPNAVLPGEPGEFVTVLARSMGKDWGYYPVAWGDGELVMETREPLLQRVAIPRAGLDAAGIRGLVAEVARQKETAVDEVLVVMMD